MLHGNGYGSDAETSAAGCGRRNRKIREESCQSFTCVPPWLAFTQWFKVGKFKKGKMETEKISGLAQNNATVNGKEADPLNCGAGYVLIYLAAATRNEVSKMVQLQQQMDLRLQNFENQMFSKSKSKSKSSSISTISHAGVRGAQGEDSSSRHDQKHELTDKSLRMALLQEELEAEFDRLQLQENEEQQYSEMTIEESAPEWSLDTARLERLDHEEQQELSNQCYYCVPPLELERKLHELLESTQQSRINELEAALEYAMQKLGDKEREVSWWKDTARLISQRFPGINHELHLQRQRKMEIQGEEQETGKKFGKELNNVMRF